MYCHNCASSFSLFNREKACKNCGFAFCRKCLQNRVKLPTTGQEENVCKACHQMLSHVGQSDHPSSKVTPFSHSPLERRLEQLETPPPSKPIIVYKDNPRMANLKKGLSVEDQRIVDRLNRLKRDRRSSEQLPSDSEMIERLAKLKGVPLPEQSSKGVYVAPDSRPSAVKSEDLLEQMQEEVKIDLQRPDPTEELAERLARLKGPTQEVNKSRGPVGPSHMDEDEPLPSDEEAERLVDQIMEEQRLEERNVPRASNDDEMTEELPEPIDTKMIGLVRQLTRELKEEEEQEELPWCVICNDDAAFRCNDCSDDLFCQRCFVECHMEFDLKHKRQAYRKSPKA